MEGSIWGILPWRANLEIQERLGRRKSKIPGGLKTIAKSIKRKTKKKGPTEKRTKMLLEALRITECTEVRKQGAIKQGAIVITMGETRSGQDQKTNTIGQTNLYKSKIIVKATSRKNQRTRRTTPAHRSHPLNHRCRTLNLQLTT